MQRYAWGSNSDISQKSAKEWQTNTKNYYLNWPIEDSIKNLRIYITDVRPEFYP
jgi:hypothetical protein